MVPQLKHIQQILYRKNTHAHLFDSSSKHAAVALIWFGRPQCPQLLLIQRAKHKGDPWSGHMAFPGGKANASDASPSAVAERETEEEIGLVLAPQHFVGVLPDVSIQTRGHQTGMRLFPVVYYWPGALPVLHCSKEVTCTFQMYLSDLLHPRLHTTCLRNYRQQLISRPAVRIHDQFLWGLSYNVLNSLLKALRCPLPDFPIAWSK